MITSGTTELAKERRLRETRFAKSSLPTRRPQVMSLRPPSFRIVLALVGASLVLFGARGVVLGNVPMIREVNLFDWSRSASWLLEIAVVAVIPLAWIRPAMVAWLAWGTAVGALAYMLQGLWTQVELFSASSAASAAAGEFALDVPKILQSIEIRPGAVAILSGLTIQAVGLCLKQNSVSRAG
jgi:hypothetical protein